jgi:hypothetical protein
MNYIPCLFQIGAEMKFFSYDAIRVGQSLTLINGNKMDLFEAKDDDAGAFGDITFQVTSENSDSESFEVIKVNRKQGELRVTREIEERSYLVDGDFGSSEFFVTLISMYSSSMLSPLTEEQEATE